MSGAVLPDWVVEASRMPLAFAQVREDPLLDLSILDRIGGQAIRCIMIASGGCTAAAMVSTGRLSHLHLVDINPAQIALTRLKIHLLQAADPTQRLQLLGHAPMQSCEAALVEILAAISLGPDVLGPSRIIGELGPDHAGRYELLFSRLRWEMRDVADQWQAVLREPNGSVRKLAVAPATRLGRAMDDAFDRTMDLPNLIALFGAQATQNSVQPFSRHFADRTRHAIATLPTSTNPFLWQLLAGSFPEGAVYPWLTAAKSDLMPTIVTSIGTFDGVLRSLRDEFDFVHLSNILDWLTPDEARGTLELARSALRPGGLVHIRQLNSALDLPTLGPGFDWLVEDARRLHARDRSFFYQCLHLGRRR